MEATVYENEKANLEVKVQGADIVLEVKGVKVVIDGEYFLTKLGEAIPGQIDNAVIAVLIGALKSGQVG